MIELLMGLILLQAGMVGKCVVGDPPHLASESQLHADMQMTVSTARRGLFPPKLLNMDTSHVLKMQGKAEKKLGGEDDGPR